LPTTCNAVHVPMNIRTKADLILDLDVYDHIMANKSVNFNNYKHVK